MSDEEAVRAARQKSHDELRRQFGMSRPVDDPATAFVEEARGMVERARSHAEMVRSTGGAGEAIENAIAYDRFASRLADAAIELEGDLR